MLPFTLTDGGGGGLLQCLTSTVQAAMLGADSTGLFESCAQCLAGSMEADGEIVGGYLQVLGYCRGRLPSRSMRRIRSA